jgi:hypothetical protein
LLFFFREAYECEWVQVLTTDFSARAAAAVMNRLAKLSARFIGEQGFSIGIDDVTPAHELQASKSSTEPMRLHKPIPRNCAQV